jgi:hypothetical protein
MLPLDSRSGNKSHRSSNVCTIFGFRAGLVRFVCTMRHSLPPRTEGVGAQVPSYNLMDPGTDKLDGARILINPDCHARSRSVKSSEAKRCGI